MSYDNEQFIPSHQRDNSAAEPKSCPCECHKPAHEARKPDERTMIGRRNG